MWRVLVGVICFFPLSAHAAQREYVSAWFVDSLIKVFPDTLAATSKLEPTLISARNGHASLQVALRSESNRLLMLHVTAPRLLNGALSVQIYRVADVNVKSHPAETSLDEVVRSEVGPYPDPLFPLGKEISLEEKHYPQLKSDPDRYWRILENIGRTMAEYKQNVVFVPVRTLAKAYLADGVTFALACLSVGSVQLLQSESAAQDRQDVRKSASPVTDYIGSKVCQQCHREIYTSYSKTDMGRSMSMVNASIFSTIPTSASMFDGHLNRHFEVFASKGSLYQSEYELAEGGKEIFRETHKVDFIIGSGANGFGAILQQGNYLFAAPLSFYTSINNWALSPGYEFFDYGFSRPILPACIVCHSGRPQPVLEGNGRFDEPPFLELAIGCENCHGPGAAHAIEMQMDASLDAVPNSIVNPARLMPWLADNICMSCHQTGQARVLHPGKQYGDFRPGAALDDTLSVFLVPFRRESPPRDDLLEHYLSMRLSKCFQNSGGRLGCISCHDPHMQTSQQSAPAYFRQKCLACHSEQSCGVALPLRQRKSPPDDCAGCHMPKRDVKVIAHSVLTNHRIIVDEKEPFPDVAFQMTTPEIPDLVHLTAVPGKRDTPSPLTLLQAYRQVMLSNPGYRERYWALAKQLEPTQPENVFVLEAMADLSLQQRNSDGVAAAIRYLDLARSRGSTTPADYEQLARLLVSTGQQSKALNVLRLGIALIPFDAELYRLLAKTYFSLNNEAEACRVLTEANHIFPQDADIQGLIRGCRAAQPAP